VPAGDRGHGLLGRAVVALLFVTLVLGAVAAWRLDLVGRLTDDDPGPDPQAGPADVPPPPGLVLPALSEPTPVDTPLAPPGRIDPALVQAAVAPYLADPVLGQHVVGAVVDLTARRPVVTLGDGLPAMPASTTKLLTTTAALSVLGPETRFSTTVVTGGKGRIVLVGGGDPFLSSKPLPSAYPAHADLQTLAAQTAAALQKRGRTSVQLGYDDSLFSEPSFNPAWPAHYLPEHVVSRVTALWVDEGRPAVGSGRVDDPSLYAAETFAAALTAQGITVVGTPTHGVASGGRELAAVQSAPLREVAARILEVSDNEGAEVLARQVAVATGRPASFAGGTAAVRAVLAGLHVSTAGDRMYDGSGLSRYDRLRADTLLAVLHAAATHPSPRSAVTGLPVAGFTGSLASRYRLGDPAGRGDVRAKTGTLTGVHGLAGTVTTRDGAVLGFVAIADRVDPVNTLFVRSRLDELTAALAGCACLQR
jgi:D-alanyl-D-alanine carboxypeptidase/D-alanyl-D-alanine-endopeptidase (penicillin-binding protein 4)